MLQSTWRLPPQPLLEASQAPLDYPVAAIGDLLGPAVERMAEVMGVPTELKWSLLTSEAESYQPLRHEVIPQRSVQRLICHSAAPYQTSQDHANGDSKTLETRHPLELEYQTREMVYRSASGKSHPIHSVLLSAHCKTDLQASGKRHSAGIGQCFSMTRDSHRTSSSTTQTAHQKPE